jgi:hypothetical protein
MEPTDELAISLTIAEWNQILQILGEVPYRVVAPLIGKINEQAKAATMPAAASGPRVVASE